MRQNNRLVSGTVIPAILIITGAFTVVIYGLILVLTTQLDYSHRQVASEEALNIAEAGINYYKWHLAHAPDDFNDGTEDPGPYIHSYKDPQGTTVGEYSINVVPPSNGSSIVTIESTGYTTQFPNVKRKISTQYGKPSFARYAFLNNASSWYGAGITITGDVHSNNGIRMDGTNLGKVTSAQTTYMCGSETGCAPPRSRPGVWGSGGDQALWEFPVTSIDFGTVAFDFSTMRTSAIADGIHLARSNRSGYRLNFLANGTVNIRRVNSTNHIEGYSPPGEGLGADGEGGCRRRYQLIAGETNIGTYPISDNPIIFAEDHIWVEGVIKGRVTVVAAGFPTTSQNMNIWIRNNITYASYDGTNSLGLIAQNDIYFVRDVPTDFKIDGALMAQKGRIMRHGYLSSCSGTTNAMRNSLTINGAMISYNKSYWNFGSPPVSGFTTRSINYDADLLYQPPPYFPTSSEYEFISWTEE